jgi:hypothetical protein
VATILSLLPFLKFLFWFPSQNTQWNDGRNDWRTVHPKVNNNYVAQMYIVTEWGWIVAIFSPLFPFWDSFFSLTSQNTQWNDRKTISFPFFASPTLASFQGVRGHYWQHAFCPPACATSLHLVAASGPLQYLTENEGWDRWDRVENLRHTLDSATRSYYVAPGQPNDNTWNTVRN